MSNTFRQWFDAGFTDIIPVVPPGAPLSPNTTIRPQDRGKVPGMKGVHGWHSFDWRHHQATPADCNRWHAMGASIGLRGERWPGVDIDITDAALAELIEQLGLDVLGWAPVRTGRAPKRLLVYRMAEGETLGLLRLWFRGPDGQVHLIEIRGAGQQYVVDGIHPITERPFTWNERPASADALTVVTRAQIEEFMRRAAELLGMLGCDRLEREDSVGADRAHVDQAALAGNPADVTNAIAALPNSNDVAPGRMDYLRVGYAIKAAMPDEPERARDLWIDWAMRWEGNERCPDGNDLDTVEADWERMRAPYSVGAQYLYDMARTHGGFDDAALDFAPIPEVQDAGNAHAPTPKALPVGLTKLALPPRPWVLGRRFLRGAVTGGIGAPGVNKSTMCLLSALAIATGRGDLTGETVHVEGRVWVHNNEDDEEELLRRVQGMCLHYGIDPDTLHDRFYFSSGLVTRLVVAVKRHDKVSETRAVLEVIETINRLGVVYFAADPLASTHDGVSENSNEEMEKVATCFRAIAAKTGCAIDLVHHSVKNHSGNAEARAGDMNAARGAGALIGAVRIAYTLSPMGEDTARKLGVPAERATRFIRLDPAKGNYSPRAGRPRWFEVMSVALPACTDGVAEGAALSDIEHEVETVPVPVLWDATAAQAAADAQQIGAKADATATVADLVVAAMEVDRCSVSKIVGVVADAMHVKVKTAYARISDAIPEGGRRQATVDGRTFWLRRERKGSHATAPVELIREPALAETALEG